MASRSLLRRVAFFVLLVLGTTHGSLLEWGDQSAQRRRLLTVSTTTTTTTTDDDEYDSNMRYRYGRLDERRQGCSNNMQSFPGTRRRRQQRSGSTSVQLVNRVKMWPPWPLSLLQRENKADRRYSDHKHKKYNGDEYGDSFQRQTQRREDDQAVTASNTYPSAAALALAWGTQRARIGIRQLQEVGSSLWFHLPPALPPLLLVASLPRSIGDGVGVTSVDMVAAAARRTIIPLFSDPFARTLVLGGLGIAVLSWAHQELNRKQKLTRLGLPYRESSVSKVFLPPFLPEMVPEPELEALQQTTSSRSITSEIDPAEMEDIEEDDDDDDPSQIFSMLNPSFRKHLSDFYENTPLIGAGAGNSSGTHRSRNPLRQRGFFREWKRSREVRKREAAKIRRATIFDELVALRAIKRKSARRAQRDAGGEDSEGRGRPPPGFALVTGASQGIGRALAVELARWEIPLVLVARDLDRLTSLAYDLEACYGVRCCVLQADLSEMDAAERIHETTTKAGLTIDILINNAGIAYEGLSANMEISLMERMIMINTMSFAKLSKLYGKDMIQRGRGRMLMVSSMAGLTSASPNTALYGATKAFERSLAFSMSKEFEPYGVGVTCLMPGPVTNTQFRSRSGTGRALCWALPFYPRPAETVAHQGIMSLLDGDTQVLPGWQNRVFAQLIRPILPQRVETMCVQAAWTPFRFPSPLKKKLSTPITELASTSGGLVNTMPPESVQLDLRPRYSLQIPPRLLQLPTKPILTPPAPVEEAIVEEEVSEQSADESSGLPEETPFVNKTPDDTDGSRQDTSNETGPKRSISDEEDHTKVSSPSKLPASPNTNVDTSSPTEEKREVETLQEEMVPSPPPTKSERLPSPSSPMSSKRIENETAEANPYQNSDDSTSSREKKHELERQEEDQMPPTRSEAVGTTRHQQQGGRTLWPLVEDDEEEKTSDLYVSPRLGHVDLFQDYRDYSLPKSSSSRSSLFQPRCGALPNRMVQT